MSQDVVSFVGVLLALVGLILGLAVLKRRFLLGHETTRKFAHAAMGVVTAAFPWLFDSSAAVTLLAIVACAFVFSIRWIPSLQRVLHGVERLSLGEVYFPLGVAFAFHYSEGNPAIYCPPILALTFGDSLAALIGKRMGQMRYTTSEGFKTWEGSLAFVLATLVTSYAALLAFGDFGLFNAFLIALLFGNICAIIEAISSRGLDNLLIPACGVFAIEAYYGLAVPDMLARLLMLAAFICLAFAFKRYSTFNDAALFGAALALYLVWALEGWSWALSPLLVFLIFPLVLPFDYDRFADFQAASMLLFINAVAALWLGQAQIHGDSFSHFWPFSASYAIHLSMIWSKRAKAQHRQTLLPLAAVALPLIATLATQIIPILLGVPSWQTLPVLATAFACSVCSLIALLDTRFDDPGGRSKRDWLFRSSLALFGSCAVFAAA